MNLLPWREKQRKKIVIKLIAQWIVVIFVISLMLFFFLTWQQGIEKKFRQTKLQVSSLKQQLSALKGEAQNLRQNTTKQKIYHVLTDKNIELVLNSLPFIPIQQGELQKVSFDAKELKLQGIALNQQEFSAIEQFLMKNKHFVQPKLSAFNPTTKNILFEFSLYFKGVSNE